MAAAKIRVFPAADGALQVQQSPCQRSSPGPADAECSVEVESRGRLGPPLALTQRQKSTGGSPKSAVSPCPPRGDSGAARTASLLGTRLVARAFSPALPVPASCMHRALSWLRGSTRVPARTCEPACALCSVSRSNRRRLRPRPPRRREGRPGACRRGRCSLLRAF